MIKLNAELQTAYLVNSCVCPFCESRDIEGGSTLEVDGTGAWQEITCLQCRARWNDLFTLSGIEVLDDPRQRRYQFQVTGGIGNDIDISFENIDSFAGLNTEHAIPEITDLNIGQTLPYSTGALIRLEDFDPDTAAYDGTRLSEEPVTSLWYDYTNQAWVKNGVYITCRHDGTAPCGYALDRTPSFCYGRLYAGIEPAQSIIEQYANVQGQQEAKADIRSELAAPPIKAPQLRSLSEVEQSNLVYDAMRGRKPDPLLDRADQLARAREQGTRVHRRIDYLLHAGVSLQVAIQTVLSEISPDDQCTPEDRRTDDEHPLDRAEREHNEDRDAGLDEPAGYGS